MRPSSPLFLPLRGPSAPPLPLLPPRQANISLPQSLIKTRRGTRGAKAAFSASVKKRIVKGHRLAVILWASSDRGEGHSPGLPGLLDGAPRKSQRLINPQRPMFGARFRFFFLLFLHRCLLDNKEVCHLKLFSCACECVCELERGGGGVTADEKLQTRPLA